MNIKTELNVELLDPRDLTKTEAKILQLICLGWLKPKIASWLHRSYKTIDGHDENIRQKLHAHSNNEVIAIAVADGMVKISRAAKMLCICLIVALPSISLFSDNAWASRINSKIQRSTTNRTAKD